VSAEDDSAVKSLSSLIILKLRMMGFSPHDRKTKHYSNFDRKIVTGLDVSGEEIRPTKRFRKATAAKLRVMINYERRGLGREIRGRLAFWKSINPGDQQLLELEKQFLNATERILNSTAKRYQVELDDDVPF
jgi:hypothetical protein